MGYTYLLVVGLIFAFLDAFGIGANDNANNFANAVASKVVTPLQAVWIAAIFEFLGAVLVGNNVADAIRGKVINVNLYKNFPATLQLAMVCALMGSSTFLLAATRWGWPVSTTHSIIGAVLGVGVAAHGSQVVNWEYGSGRGFAGIVASWFISIAVSGVMAAALYLIMKYGVLRYKNSFQRSLVFGPVVFGFAYGILSLTIVWKGTPKLKLDKIPDADVLGIVLGTWVASTVATYFWVSLPLYRYHWLGQDVKPIDYVLGPAAPTRPVRPMFDATGQEPLTMKTLLNNELDPAFAAVQAEIAEYNEKVAAAAARKALADKAGALTDVTSAADDVEATGGAKVSPASSSGDDVAALRAKLAIYQERENTPRHLWFQKWQADFKSASIARKAYLLGRYLVCFGIDGREVVESYKGKDAAHIAYAPKWESKTEKMYVTLNVITSCMQSFAHGSNDVANAIGPLSTIYYVWANNKIPGSNSPVELWQLAFGGAAIVLGLALYGYTIMAALGNNLTYQSPSRGFCMDVGSAVTVLIASKEGFPISTTQCITGATVGVGLANGEWRAVNWKLFGWIFLSWCLTLPAAGTLAGLIYSFAAYSPTQPHTPSTV